MLSRWWRTYITAAFFHIESSRVIDHRAYVYNMSCLYEHKQRSLQSTYSCLHYIADKLDNVYDPQHGSSKTFMILRRATQSTHNNDKHINNLLLLFAFSVSVAGALQCQTV